MGTKVRKAARRFQLGRKLEGFERPGLAALAYRSALKHDDTRAVWHYRLATVLEKSGKPDAAVLAYQAALARENEDASWHFKLGSALARLERHEDAVAAYREGLRRDDRKALWHFKLGRALENAKQYEQAAEAYRDALQRDNSKGSWHFRRGVVLDKAGRREEAISAYRTALARDDSKAQRHFRLGLALEKKRKFEDAALAYQAAIDRDQTRAGWYVRLGTVLELADFASSAATGSGSETDAVGSLLKRAEEAYAAALQRDPGHDLCRYRLARCLHRRGCQAEAVEVFACLGTANDRLLNGVLSNGQLKTATPLFGQGMMLRSARKIEVQNDDQVRSYFEQTFAKGNPQSSALAAFYAYLNETFGDDIPKFVPALRFQRSADRCDLFAYDYIERSSELMRAAGGEDISSELAERIVGCLQELRKKFAGFVVCSDHRAPNSVVAYSDCERFFDGISAVEHEENYDRVLNAFSERLSYHYDRFENVPLVFSHGEMHLENIILDEDGHISIVDWATYGQAPIGFDFVSFFRPILENELFDALIDEYFDGDDRIGRDEARYIVSLNAIFLAVNTDTLPPFKWLEYATRYAEA